jgi:hypothetical protein
MLGPSGSEHHHTPTSSIIISLHPWYHHIIISLTVRLDLENNLPLQQKYMEDSCHCQ